MRHWLKITGFSVYQDLLYLSRVQAADEFDSLRKSCVFVGP